MVRNKTAFASGMFALASTAIFATTPAMAQTSVTVSGVIDVEANTQTLSSTGQRVTSLNGNAACNANYTCGPEGGLTTSYLQFAGTEDLGNGMKAGFVLATFFQPANGDDGRFTGDVFFARGANVWLSSDLGKVTMGRQRSPLFMSTASFNPFGDSMEFSPILQQTYYAGKYENGAGNVISSDTGYANAVSYSTPTFGGLSATLLISLAGENGVSNSYSGNVMYANGPLAATFAYENTTVGSTSSNDTFYLGGTLPTGTTQKVAQFGASYDFKPVKAFFQIQNNNTDIGGVGPSTSLNTFQLGASIAAGQGKWLASYAKTGAVVDHKTFSIAYDYDLSKLTDVYAAYENDQAAAYADTIRVFALGIRHRF